MLERIRAIIENHHERQAFFEILARKFPRYGEDYALIALAYDTAESAFQGEFRQTGEPYAHHLFRVALISMCYLHVFDANILAACLLHDIKEKFPSTWTQTLIASKFNHAVSEHLFWVSKEELQDIQGAKTARDDEFHEKLSRAPREPMFIKLPDRIDNVMTLKGKSVIEQKRLIAQTRAIYLPLAVRHCILYWELLAAIEEIEASWNNPA